MTVICFLSSGANAADSSNALNAIVTSNATMVAQYVLSQTTGHTRKKARIAIIIDDIGNKRADADAFALSEKVTFSILPHTPFSTQFSEFSFHQGREVMLHMPMESLHGEALGEGAILASMYPDEVEMAMLRALESVPHAIGVNNHMGSKLTQITLQMNAVMEVLNNNRLYFIDSRTTKFSKAHQIARQHGVYSATRHVFLDHFANEAFLEKQFSQMLRKARRNGSVIGIAHPYPVTIEFLKKKLDDLPDDIELISVSEYLNIQNESFMSAPRLAKENRLKQENDSQTSAIAPE
ncbi:divergent polysaccharide deacetylase family protein [Brumicola blandensis]|uniref:Divergent polysaccharide deacetylase family protein n=2 Tax=Alteromonadaceae TaxID=72275 RepID=A0AAW8R3U5_9ALTE|nr:divergent polysaccharide deacetylase family protein [Alteromonas sp. W409]MDT0582997.1 divergent polysaccharide deacetylase family protein [Alteromonas sp. W409]